MESRMRIGIEILSKIFEYLQIFRFIEDCKPDIIFYQGDKIPAGKKQYAMSFVLQDEEKTLTDQDVEKTMDRILASLTGEWGATLR